MSERPDPVVRAALVHLPVPEHTPPFWDELAARLDEVDAPAPRPRRPLVAAPAEAVAPVEPVEPSEPSEPVEPFGDAAPVPLAVAGRGTAPPPAPPPAPLLPATMRRRSNLVLAALAAAATVTVVVAGVNLVRERDATVGTAASGTTAPAEDGAAPLDGSGAPGSAGAQASTSVAAGDAAAAVRALVGALATGDVAAAWDLLGPVAQDDLGSEDGLRSLGSALAEGYGAWSAVEPDRVVVTPVGATGGDAVVVVTMVGDVPQEGSVNRRSDAFLVRAGDAGPRVELFGIDRPEFVVPSGEGDDALAVGTELAVDVPAGATTPVLRLDDGDTVVCGAAPGTRLEPRGDGSRCAYLVPGGLSAGARVLTVGWVAEDGRLGAGAASFSVP